MGRLKGLEAMRDGQTLVAAVSGGLDSMVLLDVMAWLAPGRRWRIVVAHFNHKLRGAQSDADERLVRARAAELGLRFCAGRCDVGRHARRKGISIEMAARGLRHAFLASVARKTKATTILTGHHANDQAELFFIRLFRGSSAEGLAGMRAVGRSPADPALSVVRPLLTISRKQIAEYAQLRKVPFREDSTNASTEILRNRIRLELLPELRTRYAASIDRTIARVMETLGSESDFVEEAASSWMLERGQKFEVLHPAIQRRCIVKMLLARGIQPEFSLVEHFRLSPGIPIEIPGLKGAGLRFTSKGCLEEVEKTRPELPGELSLKVTTSGKQTFSGVQMAWKLVPTPELPLKPTEGCEHFDLESVGKTMRLRTWRPGDRFQPVGMKSPVKLQDLFTNAKVPRAARRSTVVAEDSQGRIFWVEGLRISEVHKITGTTKRALRLRFERGCD